MKAAKRVIKNTGILYIRMAVTVLISLYTTRVILSALGPVDYGLFNVVGSSIAMLGFLHSSMAASSQRFISHAEGKGDKSAIIRIFNTSVVLHGLIAILVFIALQIAGILLFKNILKIPADRLEAVKLVYQCVIISTIFSVISVPYDAVLTAHENMLLYSVISVVEVLLKLGLAIYVSHSAFDHLKVYGILTATTAVIILVIQRIYCHLKYDECKISPADYFDKKIFKEISALGGWSFFSSFVSLASNYGTGILINFFFPPIVNAAQGIANQINGQVGTFSSVMMNALNPIITKSEGAGNRKLMLNASMTGAKMAIFLFVLVGIPVFFEAPFVLKVWIKKFPDMALIFCRLLVVKTVFEIPFYTLNTALFAHGNIKKPNLIRSAILLFPIPLTYLLYSLNYPPYSLYIVFLICNLLKDSVTVYFAHKLIGASVKGFLKEVIMKSTMVITSTCLVVFVAHHFLVEGFFRFFIVSAVNFVVLLPFTFFIMLNENEKNIFVRSIQAFSSKAKVIFLPYFKTN